MSTETREVFGKAPGRLEIFGNHTDYNQDQGKQR